MSLLLSHSTQDALKVHHLKLGSGNSSANGFELQALSVRRAQTRTLRLLLFTSRYTVFVIVLRCVCVSAIALPRYMILHFQNALGFQPKFLLDIFFQMESSYCNNSSVQLFSVPHHLPVLIFHPKGMWPSVR